MQFVESNDRLSRRHEICQHGANDSTNMVGINTAVAGKNALPDLTQPCGQSSFVAGDSQLV